MQANTQQGTNTSATTTADLSSAAASAATTQNFSADAASGAASRQTLKHTTELRCSAGFCLSEAALR